MGKRTRHEHGWTPPDGLGPKAAALAGVLLRREIAGGNGSTNLLIAQSPWTDGDRWIATSFTSASKRPPSGRLSVLVLAPAGLPQRSPWWTVDRRVDRDDSLTIPRYGDGAAVQQCQHESTTSDPVGSQPESRSGLDHNHTR
jgi:hypothetical protein